MNHCGFEELDGWLGNLRDGQITAEEMDQLQEVLSADGEARQYYIEYMDLASTLHQYLGQGSHVSAQTAPVSPPRRRGIIVRSVEVVAALLLVGAIVGIIYLWQQYYVPAAFGEGAVAVLTRSVDAEWHGAEDRLAAGVALRPDRLQLTSGLAMVDFYSGAHLMLEGPADFELVSTKELNVSQGRFTVDVPENAVGFTVGSRDFRIVAIATRFGVAVDARGNIEVQVFEGELKFYSEPEGAASRTLRAGRGLWIDNGAPGGAAATETEVDTSAFIGVDQFEERWGAALQARYQAWKQSSDALRRDPRVVLYYDFNNVSPLQRTLKNAVTSERPGRIVGCSPAEGRWPNKIALEFKRSSDRVQINVPGKFKSLTLMAWVRLDGLEWPYNSLLLTDGFDATEVHWQIRHDGRIEFSVEGDDDDYIAEEVVIPRQDFGRWVQLATVYDHANHRLTHYADGKIVSVHKTTFDFDLTIGAAEIGNWQVADRVDQQPIRALNGRMDEFVVLAGALSSAEIADLFEKGTPY